jgi:hypothetical protein
MALVRTQEWDPRVRKNFSGVEMEQGSVVVSKFHGLIFQPVSEKVLGRVYPPRMNRNSPGPRPTNRAGIRKA